MSGGRAAAQAPAARPPGPAGADQRDAVAAADDGPAVAGGGQEPVEYQAHDELPAVSLKVVTA